MRHVFAIILAFQVAAKGPTTTNATQAGIELQLGGTSRIGQEFVLDFGILGVPNTEGAPTTGACQDFRSFAVNKTEVSAILSVRADGELNVMAIGSKLSAVLKGGSGASASTGARELQIRFSYAGGDVEDLNVVYVLKDSIVVAEIIVDYTLLPSRLVRTLDSGSLPSSGANVTNWRDFVYRIEAGPPPPHYELVRACSWLTGDRACGAFSECSMAATDQNVTMSFALQGHNESDPAVRNSEGHVGLAYRLRESQPTLSVRDVSVSFSDSK